nr:hypothetical protein Iba_chr14fCG1170 [Ipomoea batatas]GME08215.1 hypothetical protein Iba_scaffold7373CG0200 [Ipomoea batatas]
MEMKKQNQFAKYIHITLISTKTHLVSLRSRFCPAPGDGFPAVGRAKVIGDASQAARAWRSPGC